MTIIIDLQPEVQARTGYLQKVRHGYYNCNNRARGCAQWLN
jgi:hypothetical protein